MDIAVKRYFKEYLDEALFKDVPIKPDYSKETIKKILIKGGILKVPFGFLHRSLKK